MIGHPPHTSGWQVHTNDALYRAFAGGSPVWFWSAWGPHGFQSGAEETAEGAAEKGYAASRVLAEMKFEKKASS